MSTISELDAAVEEYNGVVKRQQEANQAELQPLALRIQELQDAERRVVMDFNRLYEKYRD